MQDRLLVPINEAHWQVGVGRSKFYEYVASGDIEVVKVGRRTLVPQASLQTFVDRLRAAQAGPPLSGSPSSATRVHVGADPGRNQSSASAAGPSATASGASGGTARSGRSA